MLFLDGRVLGSHERRHLPLAGGQIADLGRREGLEMEAGLIDRHIPKGVADQEKDPQAIERVAGVAGSAAKRLRAGENPLLDIAADRARFDPGVGGEVLEREGFWFHGGIIGNNPTCQINYDRILFSSN